MVLPGFEVMGVVMLLPGGPEMRVIVIASCWCSPSACTVNSARQGAEYDVAGVGGTTKEGAIGSTTPPPAGAAVGAGASAWGGGEERDEIFTRKERIRATWVVREGEEGGSAKEHLFGVARRAHHVLFGFRSWLQSFRVLFLKD